ncbi:MAG: four helix bundle protein [Chloroflexi bacterium]|nr:four helix bundle protein [Chloroflexota bacterium]
MAHENLKQRTKEFSLRVIRLTEALPNTRTADVIGRQLLRSGTSVGANYRAASRAKSPADFIAKMGIVEEEADESLFWMELLVEANLLPQEKLVALMQEANELVAITVASINTAKQQVRK